jgi:hypothetical protein
MIYPPVAVQGDKGRLWYSVQVDLPADVEAAINAQVEHDDGLSWTVAIHGALYGYRTTRWTKKALQAEFEAAILEGLKGKSTPVTPAFWADLRTRAAANQQRIRELRATGQLGNLLLPKELYEFIGAEIASGRSNTPTDVVVAAMPYLKAPAAP